MLCLAELRWVTINILFSITDLLVSSLTLTGPAPPLDSDAVYHWSSAGIVGGGHRGKMLAALFFTFEV